MKILTLSDTVVSLVHSTKMAERFRGIDLVLSCGDLPYDYLEFVVTMLNKPLYYVLGNHAQPHIINSDGTLTTAPGGCTNLHMRTIVHNGLIIGGLEGSMRYRPGDHQYTQSEMRVNMWRMAPRLWANRLRYGRPIDILITHAPPRDIHDGQDLCHQGFDAFLEFMDRHQPLYLIHGHTHLYRQDAQRITQYGRTTVLNTYGYQVIEIDETALEPSNKGKHPSSGPDAESGARSNHRA